MTVLRLTVHADPSSLYPILRTEKERGLLDVVHWAELWIMT
jgi:hypothetical protein